MDFKINSEFLPLGDQPQAINSIVDGFLNKNYKKQTLKGITGSGKTFTMANIIEKMQKPTLILAHNKTLAAQLCTEFRRFFPHNAIEYFVSYYDYYQPESYIASTDTYIEKDCSINDEIERLRHSATSSLFERKDVIIIASVSCIYSLGDPIDYKNMVISLRPGMIKDRDEIIQKLISIQYERNDIELSRNKFRVRGDTLEVFPSSISNIIKIEFFGDEIEKISEINPITGEVICNLKHFAIYPASHYVMPREKLNCAIDKIKKEAIEREKYFAKKGKLVEMQRIKQRVNYDIEMLNEIGFCKGIENYSAIISGRSPGSTPCTLFNYLPKDFLMFIDESHVTLPQVKAMYKADKSRKENLIENGFRLPSAFDNRPMNFDEFYSKLDKVVFVSATPGDFELEQSENIAYQIIRPTGLLDPEISVRPTENQIDDLIGEINKRVEKNEKVLITTLTKKMAENLSDYLKQLGIKVTYMHSDIDTIERMKIVQNLRSGVIDVIIGINLLREGLDIPEVSLVAILDADKQGFLRSERSLIQTIGRAARNVNGHVIMYADKVTMSMKIAINETMNRRKIQNDYNKKNNITPKTIQKEISNIINISDKVTDIAYPKLSKKEKENLIIKLTKEMKQAAKILQFEHAAFLRDEIEKIKNEV